ncbi:MAG: hypothetical protein PWQ55_1096 [Chloroflexota bacterium]|nr:hypothetical protein [Chloroflexota bacterium]
MKFKPTFIILLAILCLGSAAGCSGQAGADGRTQDSAQAAAELNPKAVAVNTYSGSELTLLDPQGEAIGSIPVEDSDALWPDNTVFTGKLDGDAGQLPFVFTTYAPQATIQLHRDGSDQTLRSFESLGSLAGSRGEPAIAFSEATSGEYALMSYLYVGSLDSVGFSTSVYEMKDYLKQWAIAPQAVEVTDGQPSGVWFTNTGWGVGGPGMFFPITEGLYYYDVASGGVKEYLGEDESFQGLSPDRGLAGSIPSSSYADHEMTVTNLLTHWKLTFPLKATSDQGAGSAVFAPDGQHVAWLEVGESPYSDYEYDLLVRVGNLENGEVELEIDENAAMQALGINTVDQLQPLGWLDSDTLLIQVRGLDWSNAMLLQMRLSDRQLTQFGRGAFVSFIY